MSRTVKQCAHCERIVDSWYFPRINRCPVTGHKHELVMRFVDIDYTEVR